MIYPTIDELTKGEFNRYELVIGVAKCARIVTDEYVAMRAKAQKMIDDRETEKPLSALIDPEYEESIKATVTERYLAVFPHLADKFSVHFCETADGVKL